jgi:hypothetical protein
MVAWKKEDYLVRGISELVRNFIEVNKKVLFLNIIPFVAFNPFLRTKVTASLHSTTNAWL